MPFNPKTIFYISDLKRMKNMQFKENAKTSDNNKKNFQGHTNIQSKNNFWHPDTHKYEKRMKNLRQQWKNLEDQIKRNYSEKIEKAKTELKWNLHILPCLWIVLYKRMNKKATMKWIKNK